MLDSEYNCYKLSSLNADLGVVILKAIVKTLCNKKGSLSMNRESEPGVIGLYEGLLAKL